MRTITLLISIVLLSNTYSQILYDSEIPVGTMQEGYVVTLDGDTIYGTIKVTSYTRLQKKLVFLNEIGEQVIYYPPELNCFHFANVHFKGNVITRYVGAYLPDTLFMQQLNDGYVEYYVNKFKEIQSYGGLTGLYEKTQFYIKRGLLNINKVEVFESNSIYINDHPVLDSIVAYRRCSHFELANVFHDYNVWLNESGKINTLIKRDSIWSNSGIDIYTAETDSLLYYLDSDSNISNYYYRIIHYGLNTPGYKWYVIYDKRYEPYIQKVYGLRININGKLNKIGNWFYYRQNENLTSSWLEKVECYDSSGKLHGQVVKYNADGSIKSTKNYHHGKKR